MRRKIIAVLLTGTLAMGMMAGCGSSTSSSGNDSSSSDSKSSSSEDGYNVSVILKIGSSEYWGYVQKGAEAYGEEHPEVTVDVKGPTSTTAYDEQLNMIETDLNSGAYDALVIGPLNGEQVAHQISGQTIPIVALDSDIDAPECVTFVGTGNEDAAKEGGKAAVEAAKEAGWEDVTAIMLAGVQGDSTDMARQKGFEEGITEAGGTYLADEVQYADCVADKAVTSMEAIMQTHPEGVSVIVASSDDMAIAAAKTAKGNKAFENTIFCGFDGIQSACESILDDEETMSVAQQAYEMGYESVEKAVAALNGEELDDFYDTGCSIITKDNAQERLDTLIETLGEDQ